MVVVVVVVVERIEVKVEIRVVVKEKVVLLGVMVVDTGIVQLLAWIQIVW